MRAVAFAFDFTSWYAYVAYAAAPTYLLWRTVIRGMVEDYRDVKRRVRPPRPEPEPEPEPPPVSLSNISASISYTHDAGAPHRRLATVRPTYVIYNDAAFAVTDVTTGCRRRGTAEGGHRFAWQTAQIRPGGQATVGGHAEIPELMLQGVHESEAQRAFTFWVRFKDERGEEWEAWREAADDGASGHRRRPEPLPVAYASLDMRLVGQDERRYRVEIENDGDVAVQDVECLLPEAATNWTLMTEVLHAYPIPVLEPGDVQRIPVGVFLGGPSSVVAKARGSVAGATYERERTLSIF